MTTTETKTESFFSMRDPSERDKKYEAAVSVLQELANRNQPTEKVFRILNRIGNVDDEGFTEKIAGTEKTKEGKKGKYRLGPHDDIMFIRNYNGNQERSFGLKAGENLKKLMISFGECIDELLEDTHTNPFELAAFAHFLLVNTHPFYEGNGRTARLLMNYILVKKGLPPKNLDAELYEHRSGRHTIQDYEIDDSREFGKLILQFSHDLDLGAEDRGQLTFEEYIKDPISNYLINKARLIGTYMEEARKGNIRNIPYVTEMAKVMEALPNNTT